MHQVSASPSHPADNNYVHHITIVCERKEHLNDYILKWCKSGLAEKINISGSCQ
jgi:hypothetical protein